MPTNNADDFTNPIGVANGGLGTASLTAYAPICGGTTSTSALQSAITNISTGGYLLTGNGASTLPSWNSPPAWVLLQTVSISSINTITFTPTGSYNTYLIIFNYVSGNATNMAVNMTWSVNGSGGPYLTTGYQSSLFNYAYNSATPSQSSSTTAGRLVALNVGDILGGFVYLTLPTTGTPSYVSKLNRVTTTPSLLTFNSWGNNSSITTFVNSIKISVSGLLLTGSILFYGLSS